MQVKPGMKLHSTVCDAVFMLIKGAGDLDLACGGVALSAQAPASLEAIDEAFAGGTATGKRYQDPAETVELLCVKAGKGTPTLGGVPLEIKAAKALPSSD